MLMHEAGCSRLFRPFTIPEIRKKSVRPNVRAFFVCTRSDLLSGEPARVLDIPLVQAFFVDRIPIPSIVSSGITVWGEDLLARVALLPIRRLDVATAFFGLFNQVLFTAMVYPLLPGATKYAMDGLKRRVHNCHFCYQLRPAPLAEEVAFFEQRHGPSAALTRLLSLRTEYRPSSRFVLRCLPAIARCTSGLRVTTGSPATLVLIVSNVVRPERQDQI